jgi:hypothetical protein
MFLQRWEQPVQHPDVSCYWNLEIMHSQSFAATYIHAEKSGSMEPFLLMTLKTMLHA